MQIAIFDDYQDAVRTLPCFARLAGHQVTVITDMRIDRVDLAARLAEVEALILIRERTRIDDELLVRLPKLKLISQTGKISPHLDLEACTAGGIAVTEGMGSPVAPAELCFALILAASRRIAQYCENLKAGRWQQSGSAGIGRRLAGSTLGIWGYGKIGRLVAGFGQAFGMRILVFGREASISAAQRDGHAVAGSAEELFSEADTLSLHLRLNTATRGCVTAALLARMRAHAVFVNTSRAELVEPDALLAALRVGRPGLAALDVFYREPLPGNDPLLALDNVICTPHLGYVEQHGYELYFSAAIENVLAYADGRPTNVVNPEVLP